MSEVTDETITEDYAGRIRQPTIRNNSSECAALINHYWLAKGYDAQARTTKTSNGLLTIKSNMINGYPTKAN